MTENEIIKAAECCVQAERRVDCVNLGCPACKETYGCIIYDMTDDDSDNALMNQMVEELLGIINRQKAEIERRKNNLFCKVEIDEETMRSIVKEKVAEFELDIKSIKAEAIKEFAQSVKDLAYKKSHSDKEIYAWYEDIDNLAKEMVGDTE